jgi:hypothetical protein
VIEAKQVNHVKARAGELIFNGKMDGGWGGWGLLIIAYHCAEIIRLIITPIFP